MSIITTPGNGTAFTTAELILNFERLAYLSTQHGDEPEPDPIVPVPDTEYTLLDVYNDVYRNVPNYIEQHGKRLIWNMNRIRKVYQSLPGVTDAEWDQLIILMSTSAVNEEAIIAWIYNSVDLNASLTVTEVKYAISKLVTCINVEVSLMNKWFNLSLIKFDETQLFIALDDANLALAETELSNLAAIAHAITDYAVPNLVPKVDIRPEDANVVVDRLVNYSSTGYLPDTIVTSPWSPYNTNSVLI
jgi:hypothetical protein